MIINKYNYWLYSFLTLLFSYILLKIFDSYLIVILFYTISCLYLSLYLFINQIVNIQVNNKFKKNLKNYDCVINECKKKICTNFDDNSCINEKYCIFNDS